MDCIFPLASADGTLKPDSPLMEWSLMQLDSTRKMGIAIDSARHYQAQLLDAGYVDVQVIPHARPMNTWPRDKKHKEIGIWQYENFMTGLEGFTMAACTRLLGWSEAQVQVYLVGVRKDMKDTSIHSYLP